MRKKYTLMQVIEKDPVVMLMILLFFSGGMYRKKRIKHEMRVRTYTIHSFLG